MNHLQTETSAYLLQHVDNPVEWYAWNAQSLQLARELNKPILLSIGYSACHWCHVMAHESFADAETASIMNQHFINIKVDKEERPDLDKIYQTAHQIISQRPGGWPLTIALEPHSLLPFFAGTYFPKEAKLGLPAFTEVLQQIIHFYTEQKQKLHEHQQQLAHVFKQINQDQPITQNLLTANALTLANQQLTQLFDAHNGGFGQQPKFPQPSNLERLLRYSFYEPSQKDHTLARFFTTLDKMACGGIYDHLGGGFFRYSVDNHWMIPHFEKMLYDNAQLLSVYSDAYLIEKKELYHHVILQTAQWVMQHMQAPTGGYYATLDADSEGEEGKFYVWDRNEIQHHLSAAEYAIFADTFGLHNPANFENHWHLYVADSTAYPPAPNSILAQACTKLLTLREQRVRPHRDEKIITSWNGLMIKGMAKAGAITGHAPFIQSAIQAVEFIQHHLWHNQRLFSTYQAKQARFAGYLDDYAYLLAGVLQLLEAEWSNERLHFAQELANAMIKNFWDEKNYGFFFTAHDHETLIYRPKPVTDEAVPSGNGVAAMALFNLGYLLGESSYLEIAEKTLLAAQSSINHLPYAHNSLLHALEDYLQPPKLVIIRGACADLPHWQHAIQNHFDPQRHTYAIPNDITGLPAALAEKVAQQHTVAYVCEGMQCQAPITNLTALT